MVVFLTSLAAYQKMRATILTAQYSVWSASGILTESESEALYSAGIDLTIFNYEVDIHDEELLEGALHTIREHHGDIEIWLDNAQKCNLTEG